MTMAVPFVGKAQLAVTTGQTAQQLAEIIAGAGVVVSNASITGSPQAVGAFVNGGNPTNLGLTSGVVLSSGLVTQIPGNAGAFTSNNHGQPGHPFLEAQAGVTSWDAVVLQFDFVPNADLIQFNYVFGSEEYPEFVCQGFNDMFAFTITGVSVPMPQTNIALIPGTNTPVSINSVNDQGCGTATYYLDNGADQVVSFDGLTVTMTAESEVLCGETYTLRLMISDGGDGIYDSGCFIQENSLTTGNVSVETSTATGDNFVYEGCGNAVITLTLNGPPTQQAMNVPIWISNSTATPGVDYNDITIFNADSTITIPAGQSSVSFTITAPNDNVAEQNEYIEFVFINSTCGTTDTFQIFIADLVPITIQTSNDTTICTGNAIVWAQGVGGGGLYTYQWDNGMGTDPDIAPAPTVSTVYTVTVNDNCNSSPATASVSVGVDGGPSAFAGNDVGVCIGGSVLLNASSNTPNVSYSWSPTTGLSNPNIANPMCAPAQDTQYTVTVTRNDGCQNSDAVQVNLTPPPTSEFIVPAYGCVGKPIIVTYTGNADASAQFQWNFDGGTVTNGNGIGPIAVMWQQAGVYDVVLTVAWGGCVSTTETRQVEILDNPPVDAGTDHAVCPGEMVDIGSPSQTGVTYSWSPANAVTNPDAAATSTIAVNSSHTTVSMPLILTANEQGCLSKDTVFVTVYAKPTAEFEVPQGLCFNVNSFSLDAGGFYGPTATFYWNFGPVGFPGSSTQQNPQGFIFNTPGTHDVKLVVTDNGCVSDTFSAPIEVFPMPVADFAVDTNQGCEPFGVQFLDLSDNVGSPLYYSWQFGNGATSNTALPSLTYMAGTYNVNLQVTTHSGCSHSRNRNAYIVAHPKPTAYFSLNAHVFNIFAPKAVATNRANGVTGSLFIFHPYTEIDGMVASFEYPDTGTFTVTQIVTTQFGCLDTLSTTLKVNPAFTLYIPEAFTPNNDGVNEIWKPEGESVENYHLRIFNRWDQQLFESNELGYGWDGSFHGTQVPQGIYTYRIRVYDVLGEPHNYFGKFSLYR
ncbi:MAG: choice-of-anchor L domain-containing protein [Flavobacteriales bacterium]|nr:choice-of-anchor L domain-containing protein [Flavobacteriales bacterium]